MALPDFSKIGRVPGTSSDLDGWSPGRGAGPSACWAPDGTPGRRRSRPPRRAADDAKVPSRHRPAAAHADCRRLAGYEAVQQGLFLWSRGGQNLLRTLDIVRRRFERWVYADDGRRSLKRGNHASALGTADREVLTIAALSIPASTPRTKFTHSVISKCFTRCTPARRQGGSG